VTPPQAGTTRSPAKATDAAAQPRFDVQHIRAQFPILHQEVNGKPLVYLDSAATSQKPLAVINEIDRYYREFNANVHRGIHHLSDTATAAFERTRVKASRLINATDARQIVFIRGTTEAINLVAQSYGRTNLRPGDEVLISTMEHHSNIVPWQLVCEQTGAKLRVIPINDCGEIILDEAAKLLTSRTKLVSVGHISNALGTINPVKEIINMAHERGARVMIDGAQAAPHIKIDVQELDCDFYALSGHKMFGPTGIGVLYGKYDLLDAMPPYHGGGEMIKNVTFEKTIYNDLPYKFEAGTPHIEGVIGLGAAIDWINELDWEAVAAHEHDLLEYGSQRLQEVPGLRMIGTAANKASILNFIIDRQHPYEVGQILDHEGIAIRTGHHCAQPVMERFGVPATCRASLALYNTREEIDALIDGLHKAGRLLA
jgi:cysteine desulfurase/selenocysteine lyase